MLEIEFNLFEPFFRFIKNKNNCILFYDSDSPYPTKDVNIFVIENMIKEGNYDDFKVYLFIVEDDSIYVKEILFKKLTRFLNFFKFFNNLYEMIYEKNLLEDKLIINSKDLNIDDFIKQIIESENPEFKSSIENIKYSGIYIPPEVFSLFYDKNIPYSIDFFKIQKYKKRNATQEEIVRIFYFDNSYHFENKICYIDFFQYFLDDKYVNYLKINDFDMLNELNCNEIFSIVNELYFKAIQEQQKLEYSYFVTNFDSNNKKGHSKSPSDFINMLIKVNKLDFKNNYQNEEKYNKTKEGYIKIKNLIREKDLRRNKDFIQILKNNIEEKYYEEIESLEYFLVLKYMNNFYDMSIETIFNILKKYKIKNQHLKNLFKQINRLIFNQFLIIEESIQEYKILEHDLISSSKYTQKYSEKEILNQIDLYYLSDIYNFLKENKKNNTM